MPFEVEMYIPVEYTGFCNVLFANLHSSIASHMSIVFQIQMNLISLTFYVHCLMKFHRRNLQRSSRANS